MVKVTLFNVDDFQNLLMSEDNDERMVLIFDSIDSKGVNGAPRNRSQKKGFQNVSGTRRYQ